MFTTPIRPIHFPHGYIAVRCGHFYNSERCVYFAEDAQGQRKYITGVKYFVLRKRELAVI